MQRICIFAVLLLTVIACCIRVVHLDSRPMHHDEANQAVKAGNLQSDGYYKYDSHDHHGPSLYYLSMLSVLPSCGRDFTATTEKTFRIVPVVFGVLLIPFLFLFVDSLGWCSVISSALLITLSPAMVYYSRYYIQEMLLVFFTFMAISSGWRYTINQRLRWMILCGFAIGMMYATKETCVIAYGGFLVAIAIVAVTSKFSVFKGCSIKRFLRDGVIALFVALFVVVLLYSSFFTNWHGVLDSIQAYASFSKKASSSSELHRHPWYYYLQMLVFFKNAPGPWWSEGIIVLLALVASIAAWHREWLGRIDPNLARGLFVYTIFITVVYSLIPYKTPWCILSMLHGMILLAGIGVVVLYNVFNGAVVRCVISILLFLGVFSLTSKMLQSNFRYSADSRNPYAYVHTSMNFMQLIKRIEQISTVSDKGHEMFIKIVAPADKYWPLPWYLRKYANVGYWSSAANCHIDLISAIIITVPAMEKAVLRGHASDYTSEFYSVREDVLLHVFIRNDLWSAFIETVK